MLLGMPAAAKLQPGDAGSSCTYLGIGSKVLEKAITAYFAKKGETIVATNLRAFRLGAELTD